MGIAEMLLGAQNPFSQFVAGNRNAIRGVGMGLASGNDFNTGLANAAMYAGQGAVKDDAFATAKKEEAKREAQLQKTIDYVRSSNPQLAELVAAGMEPNEAFKEILNLSRPKEPTQMDIREAGGDIIGIDPYTGAARNLYDAETPAQEAPKDYRWKADGAGLEPIPGGPADPANPLNARKAAIGPMDATTKKELFEAEDAAVAGDYVLSALDEAMQLNDKAYDGPFSDVRGDTTALFGDESGIATSRLKNVTTELALSQLKTIFGAMPTEGERKILLELQGSVNQPKKVREAIYKRAKEMAERRIADNKRKAEALRSGAYFEPGGATAAPGGGQTSTGLQWSIEP